MKANGLTPVKGLQIATLWRLGEVFVMEAESACRRMSYPSNCVVDGCWMVAEDFAAIDCLPGADGVTLIPLCREHGQTTYEALWGVPEDD